MAPTQTLTTTAVVVDTETRMESKLSYCSLTPFILFPHLCVCVYVRVCVRVCVCVLQEDFRLDQGVRLLTTIERVFARRMSSPEGTWVIYLSKPTHQQHQLLMNVASVHGTPTYTRTHTHTHVHMYLKMQRK